MERIEDITDLRQRLITSASILAAIAEIRNRPGATTEIEKAKVSVIEAQILDFELRDLERTQRQHESELRRER